MAEHPALSRCRVVAGALDSAVRVPGTERRVGIDPLVGLVPGYGDALAAALSMYVVAEAALAGVPAGTLLRMCANVALDAAIGSVPVLGDLFDAAWKANERNVALFEEHLDAAQRA
jgi:hypothetical protein